MEIMMANNSTQSITHQQEQAVTGQQGQARVAEKLNTAVQQQLNLDSVKTRAISLFKAISRILDELDLISRTNSVPKWQNMLGQFSMVNLELYNIVEDINKVSKAFIVLPKSVNADNSTILPVMLSSKLLPEMEMDDNAKRDQLLLGVQNMPILQQIEKLKLRVNMIEAACVSAEKIITDTRRAYFGSHQGLNTVPTMDKVQAAKIQEQETLLRNAVNHGEGLRVHGEQRQITSALPLHLVGVLPVGDTGQPFPDASGIQSKNTPLPSNNINSQGNMLQASGTPHMGRAVAASPSGGGMPSFDNTAASPMQYANSPRSGTANMMNTPSPQPQSQQQQLQQPQPQPQQHQQQQQMQQRQQKIMQLPPHQQQQILAQQQQQFRQSSMSGVGQIHGQHQMQYSSAMGAQQFQGRQMPHGIGQGQFNQGNQLNRHLNQFANSASSALFNAAQNSPNPQMISNMSATMSSQSLLPRMQFGLSGSARNHSSHILSDQMFNMGATNPGNMMPMQQQQQQQHGSQGVFGNMSQSSQNMQPNMGTLQQNHPNFQQQRQQQNQP